MCRKVALVKVIMYNNERQIDGNGDSLTEISEACLDDEILCQRSVSYMLCSV